MPVSDAQKVSTLFDRIERTSVTAQVRDQLVDSIRLGRLLPGERLPAERRLCQEFGVARTTIREAVKQLESLGVVERRNNNRLHVVDHLGVVEVPLEGAKKTVRELFETRRVIEIAMTELATFHATASQRKMVDQLSEQFRPGMDLGQFRDLDHRFHASVAAACGNPLLAELYGRVLQALFTSPAFASLLYAEVNREEVSKIIERSAYGHREIAVAVTDGDPIRAAAAADDHLREVEERMIRRLI